MLQSFALGAAWTYDCRLGVVESFALRIGARPAVEVLLAEIRADWSQRDPEGCYPASGRSGPPGRPWMSPLSNDCRSATR